MLLIGSQALLAQGLTTKSPKDYDYIMSSEEYAQFITENIPDVRVENKKYGKILFYSDRIPVEVEIIELRPSSRLLFELKPDLSGVASLDLVYAFKMSHRYLKGSKHFQKTMQDIKNLRQHGATIPQDLVEWFKLREKETYDYKHPTLNKTRKEFFVDNFYVYDHDSIHEAVKLYDEPAYNYIKVDKAEVLCSKDKFDSADERVKLATVYEESCVLALERHQIPNQFKPPPEVSFFKALETVCTGISSGWWREFAWENYEKVVRLYLTLGKGYYIQCFNKALENNKLKPHSL